MAQEPEVPGRVSRLRGEMIAEAVGRLSSTCTAAAAKMAALVESNDEKTALQAAKAVLDSTLRIREQLELAQRIESLEASLHQGGRP